MFPFRYVLETWIGLGLGERGYVRVLGRLLAPGDIS